MAVSLLRSTSLHPQWRCSHERIQRLLFACELLLGTLHCDSEPDQTVVLSMERSVAMLQVHDRIKKEAEKPSTWLRSMTKKTLHLLQQLPSSSSATQRTMPPPERHPSTSLRRRSSSADNCSTDR